ncbi:MAG: SUMF1/EgtB/PvdO family nonheme iron enzyme [Myxococcaceae bacterium]|nr:SUMF1/EgtB/PvdO family nonheme iron enzyme [Myxococcaceae bacterium]
MRWLVPAVVLCGCLRTVSLGSNDAGWDGGEADDAGFDARACSLDACPACSLACARTLTCLADGGMACGCVCTRTVALPGGTFTMGCEPSSPGCEPDEQPAREVTVFGFEMHRTEVTQADYQRCITDALVPCSQPSGEFDPAMRANEPVTNVTYVQASIYCASEGMQLPTESQWEYAARLDAGVYPWGDAPPDCDRAHFADCGATKPEPAGAHQLGASPAGILGLADNVREWTSDEYSPGNASVRGGAYDSMSAGLRSVSRAPYLKIRGAPNIGFRCVK